MSRAIAGKQLPRGEPRISFIYLICNPKVLPYRLCNAPLLISRLSFGSVLNHAGLLNSGSGHVACGRTFGSYG